MFGNCSILLANTTFMRVAHSYCSSCQNLFSQVEFETYYCAWQWKLFYKPTLLYLPTISDNLYTHLTEDMGCNLRYYEQFKVLWPIEEEHYFHNFCLIFVWILLSQLSRLWKNIPLYFCCYLTRKYRKY